MSFPLIMMGKNATPAPGPEPSPRGMAGLGAQHLLITNLITMVMSQHGVAAEWNVQLKVVLFLRGHPACTYDVCTGRG